MNPQTMSLNQVSPGYNPTHLYGVINPGLSNVSLPTPQQQTYTPDNSAPASSAPQVPATPAPHESWWEKFIPTAASIIGGIAAAPLDPFTGGLASLAAAGVGSALGKMGENALTGQKVVQGNDLTAGLEGAAGQGVGKALGAGVGLLGKAAGNVGGKLADSAAQNAENQAIADQFGTLSRGFRNSNNFKDVLNLADQAGIPKTAQGFVDNVGFGTGENGYLNGTLDGLVAQNGNINLGNFGDSVDQALQKEQGLLGSAEPTTSGRGGLPTVPTNTAGNVKSQLERLLQGVGFNGEGSLNNEVTPENALSLLRQVQTIGRRYSGAEPGTVASSLNNVYSDVANSLKDAIYRRPEVQSAVEAAQADPNDIAMLLKNTGGNQKLVDFLTGTVNNAKSPDDILQTEARLMNMQNIGLKANSNIENAVPTVDENGVALSPEAAAGIQLATAHHNPMNLVRGVANFANSRLAVPALKGSGNLLDRVTANDGGLTDNIVGKSVFPGLAQIATHMPNEIGTPNPSNQLSLNTNGEPTMNPQAQNIFTSQSPLEQAIAQNALYNMFAPQLASSATQNNAFAAEQQLQKAAQSQALLAPLVEAYNNAGGSQGTFGGGLSELSSFIPGTAANRYKQLAAQEAAQLSGATGTPVSPLSLPSLMQNKQSATNALQSIQNLLNLAGGTTGINPASGTSGTL